MTINNVPANFRNVFEHFAAAGWVQPTSGHRNAYVLEHPVKGHILKVLSYPVKYVAILDKTGLEMLGAGDCLGELNKHYATK